MSEPLDAETQAFADAQAKEYGTYVCVSPIQVGGARAFNPGHPVPVSHVDANPDWVTDGLVSKVGEQAAPPDLASPPPAAAPARQGEPIVVNN